jgi:hypothetical protein
MTFSHSARIDTDVANNSKYYNELYLDLIDKKIWITKFKQRIPITKMTTDHITNTINMLQCHMTDNKNTKMEITIKEQYIKLFKEEIYNRNNNSNNIVRHIIIVD